ncbi:hypothetical protein [Streptomyces sp. NPDC053720]|uniref:hypothetical protein n=1 Tax=Streptomyces sp. NPDC053720 TaxID=3154855 RepID=UPI003416C41D
MPAPRTAAAAPDTPAAESPAAGTGRMPAAQALQTYTVIGLLLDVEPTELLIAGVLPGPLTDDFTALSTREEGLTRWAEEFDAPSADAAAAQAYEYCRQI